jgi:hypothetical protein
MDDVERDRIDRYLYPRPPADVLDAAARAGLRDPAAQDRMRCPGLSDERPLRFKCGHHNDTERDRPVVLIELAGLDGKTYRGGKCMRCGRIFWGIRGERPKRRYTWDP